MHALHWTVGLHHDGSNVYVSNPQPSLGETVRIRLRIPLDSPVRAAFMRIVPDGEPRTLAMTEVGRDATSVYVGAEMQVTMPRNPYRFKLLTSEGAYYLNGFGVSRAEPTDWGDFKLLADFQAPKWLNDTVFYQIFLDRFFNGNPELDVKPGEWTRSGFSTQHRPWGAPPLHYREAGNLDFYGGDLPGIARKLGYLHDLGVNALYLNPIFDARTNHRYDIIDFYKVDRHLGGDEALIALRRGLDQYGMRVVLDITLNHCGWMHPWFTAAQADPHSPTADFFTFYEHPHNYESWLGVRSLVKLNYRSHRLREVIYEGHDAIMRHWLRPPFRIDGWRLDVANMQGRQGAIQLHHKLGRGLRRAVKQENPQAYLFGENFYDGTLHLQGDELDAIMNYSGFTLPLWRFLAGYEIGSEAGKLGADASLLPADALAEQWMAFRAPIPWVVAQQQFNLLCSHDTFRILTICKNDKALVRLAAALLMTYPGVPSVYYGDEIGMEGGHDPDNRRCMPWDESHWDSSLRAYYQRLIGLRRSAPALKDGGFQTLYAQDGLIAYQRHSADQKLVIVGYRGPDTAEAISIPVRHGAIAEGAHATDLIGGGSYRIEQGYLHLGSLAHGAALILEIR